MDAMEAEECPLVANDSRVAFRFARVVLPSCSTLMSGSSGGGFLDPLLASLSGASSSNPGLCINSSDDESPARFSYSAADPLQASADSSVSYQWTPLAHNQYDGFEHADVHASPRSLGDSTAYDYGYGVATDRPLPPNNATTAPASSVNTGLPNRHPESRI